MRFLRLFTCLFIFLIQFEYTYANEQTNDKKPTVCLNMIVKDESQVIERCLSSVLPLIDYWVIVDTGSSDGTQEVIKRFMKEHNVPGELYERPWVNFGHNRNEALKLAKSKSDYVFFIDADEYLVYDKNFQLPLLDRDFYYITVSHSGSRYGKVQLINNQLNWDWIGVLHEYVFSPQAKTNSTIENVLNIYTTEGARSKNPLKYQKDAEILEAALKDEPNNSRYVFYLAQSYLDSENYNLALKNYRKRAEMGGWDQEIYWSWLRVAKIQEMLNEPLETVIDSYYKAFEYRPTRVEALYNIAHLYNINKKYESAYQAASIAELIPPTNDILFVEQWIYDYGILLEKSIAAYWIEKYEESQKICLQLLDRNNLPEHVRTCVKNNLGFANAKLVKKICSATAANE